MSLSFSSPAGAFEIRWIVYALLRDNVAHHLERGEPGGRFANLHRIAEALGGESISLPAVALHREAIAIEDELLALPVSQLAISASTRAVINLRWPEVTGPASEIVGPLEMFGAITAGARTLG
jgi:hypothetical protein